MNHILSKYCPRIDFDSYEDFFANFKIDVPNDFNFGYDVVDVLAQRTQMLRLLYGVMITAMSL